MIGYVALSKHKDICIRMASISQKRVASAIPPSTNLFAESKPFL
jgi:hypothetical protein